MDKALDIISKAFALTGGIMLFCVATLVCVSVSLRNLFGVSFVGDFELTASAMGAVVSLFLPYCQCQRAHLKIDFFTASMRSSMQGLLGRLGAASMGLIMLLLVWRTTIGGISAYRSQSGSMMLGFPDWIVYSFIVPSIAVTALIALWQCVASNQEARYERS